MGGSFSGCHLASFWVNDSAQTEGPRLHLRQEVLPQISNKGYELFMAQKSKFRFQLLYEITKH